MAREGLSARLIPIYGVRFCDAPIGTRLGRSPSLAERALEMCSYSEHT
jgi:hypothetical protein